MKQKLVIGRTDKIDLPELQLIDIDAKIDTGANTSAIHYHYAEVVKKEGKEFLHFSLLDPDHPNFNDKEFFVEHFKQRLIKNSFGDSELRYIIKTEIVIFGQTWETEFSLSNRGNLKFPILLGRKLLKKRFLVDVTKANLSYKKKYEKIK
ncbi:MAG: ATP-dependent zinc protease family protein [Candidatus Cyclobacteriaceae bacterium M2_1C_046]